MFCYNDKCHSEWFVTIDLRKLFLQKYHSPSSTIQGIHKIMLQFQKLTRNLFLTFHGHNVHRQQWQLSKFLVRYQQFASHEYGGAALPVSKMALQQEKAFCVLCFEVSRSVITVQREFYARFRTAGSATLLHMSTCFTCVYMFYMCLHVLQIV
jgi:hypothetical protein